MKRVSATQASRGFAELLTRVERRGTGYVVERHGKDVAAIVPVGAPADRVHTIGELLEAIRTAPKADDEFVSDLRRIRRTQGRPRNPWASSSTRHT